MGVGKTTISKLLFKELDNCFWLDGDNCWMMNPFNVNEENKMMVLDNISYILNSFINNSNSENIIFNWVIHHEYIMNDILNKVDNKDIEIYKITLMCSREEMINRINKDVEKGIRDSDNIKRSLEKYYLYRYMDTIKVNTDGKDINEIIKEIKSIID